MTLSFKSKRPLADSLYGSPLVNPCFGPSRAFQWGSNRRLPFLFPGPKTTMYFVGCTMKMNVFGQFLLAMAAICLFVATGFSDDASVPASRPAVGPTSLPAIPDATVLKEAQGLINEVYKDDIAKAKKPEEKVALARKLLQAASEAKMDLNGKYVLLVAAKDMAVRAGDVDTAWSAMVETVNAYEVDATKSKLDLVSTMAKSALLPEAHRKLAAKATGAMRKALGADQYDLAKQFAAIAESEAKQAKDPDMAKQAASNVQQVRECEVAYAKATDAMRRLTTNPKDPAANLVVGRFRCFLKGKWDKGLPMLALSSDATLKALAEKELSKTTEAEKLIELADGWWTFAEKEAVSAQKAGRLHAASLYEQALATATPLVKAKVIKRLKASELMQYRVVSPAGWPYSMRAAFDATPEIRKAAESAANFLLSSQQADGSWQEFSRDYHIGSTAIATLALLEKGVSVTDPHIKRALGWLSQQHTEKTYELGIRANVWRMADRLLPGQGYNDLLKKDVALLRSSTADGSYGYDCKGKNENKDGCNSNTQFAIFGVSAGSRGDIKVPREFWVKQRTHWTKSQMNDGGWPYDGAPKRNSSLTMTCAGLGSSIICMHELGTDSAAALKADAVKKGVDWLERHLTETNSPNTYALFALSRAGTALQTTWIGDVDWYKWGAASLVKRQDSSGKIVADSYGDVVNTAFGLLFLLKGMPQDEDLEGSDEPKLATPFGRTFQFTDEKTILKDWVLNNTWRIEEGGIRLFGGDATLRTPQLFMGDITLSIDYDMTHGSEMWVTIWGERFVFKQAGQCTAILQRRGNKVTFECGGNAPEVVTLKESQTAARTPVLIHLDHLNLYRTKMELVISRIKIQGTPASQQPATAPTATQPKRFQFNDEAVIRDDWTLGGKWQLEKEGVRLFSGGGSLKSAKSFTGDMTLGVACDASLRGVKMFIWNEEFDVGQPRTSITLERKGLDVSVSVDGAPPKVYVIRQANKDLSTPFMISFVEGWNPKQSVLIKEVTVDVVTMKKSASSTSQPATSQPAS